jgi:hypothetical protein
MELINKYREAARLYASQWMVVSEHIIDIMASVMMHRDGVMDGGGFVTSVVENNLSRAVGSADSECYKHLREIVSAREFAHL